MRLVSNQVLERCKLYIVSSSKRPSPQARHRTTESLAVSGITSVWVYQIAPQPGKGNSAQPCAHILSSPGQGMSASGKMLPESFGLPRCQDCGLAALPEEEQIFFSSCRARSRLGRSSKRLVFDHLFLCCSRTGEKQKARCLPKSKQNKPFFLINAALVIITVAVR